MAIPVRNTVRSAGVKSAYNLSYINTPSGSVIEGSVRQYATYAAMIADPAPAQLASVLNGSYDDNYQETVPQEHWGGVLYQRDSVNSTWILLYNTADITVPTRVSWEHVVDVPAWVGGVSNNRKKLIQNAYAETRTTYYSYGDYILVLPDPNTVKLGDQIALEQYKGQGAICYPYTTGEENMYLENIDGTLETTELCHVIYTTAAYAYTRDEYGHMVIDATNPVTHHSYVFTCTENEVGARTWRFNANDAIEDTVVSLRKEFFKHSRAVDPHHQYIKKNEVGKYIKSLVEVSYTLPDAEAYRLGGVYLASTDDVISGRAGNRAVTALGLNQILTNYSVVSHNHNIAELADVTGTASAGVVPMYSQEQGKFVLTQVGSGSAVFDDATTTSRGVVKLATETDLLNGSSGAIVPNTELMSSTLANYSKKGEYPKIINLTDVSIDALVSGKILTVGIPTGETTAKVILGDYPVATSNVLGCTYLAQDSEITSGTIINNKAVTPTQVINVSSKIIDEVKDMMLNSGYVLPAATVPALGGVKLINDAVLSMIMNDGPSFTSHIVDSATVVNPIQFASYFYNLGSTISSSIDIYVTQRLDVTSRRVDSASAVAAEADLKATSALTTVSSMSGVFKMTSSSIVMNQTAAGTPVSAVVNGHVFMVYNAGGSQVTPTSIVFTNGSSIITHNFGSVTSQNWIAMCGSAITI